MKFLLTLSMSCSISFHLFLCMKFISYTTYLAISLTGSSIFLLLNLSQSGSLLDRSLDLFNVFLNFLSPSLSYYHLPLRYSPTSSPLFSRITSGSLRSRTLTAARLDATADDLPPHRALIGRATTGSEQPQHGAATRFYNDNSGGN
jgi:hypothetical protein